MTSLYTKLNPCSLAHSFAALGLSLLLHILLFVAFSVFRPETQQSVAKKVSVRVNLVTSKKLIQPEKKFGPTMQKVEKKTGPSVERKHVKKNSQRPNESFSNASKKELALIQSMPLDREVEVEEDRNDVAGTQGDLQSQSELIDYLSELFQVLNNKKVYPSMSKRLREKGLVIVSFRLTRSGELREVVVKQTSRSARLDEAAKSAVESVGQFKPIPEAVMKDVLHIEVPIEFQL